MVQRVAFSAIVLLLPLLAAGCVAPGGYYGGGGYGVGYYQPSSVVYGGWSRGYAVGPVRSGTIYRVHTAPPNRAYRPAPITRPIPSIPWHAQGSSGSSHRSGSRGHTGHGGHR